MKSWLSTAFGHPILIDSHASFSGLQASGLVPSCDFWERDISPLMQLSMRFMSEST